MRGPGDALYFGQYPEDYFDFIIIDEYYHSAARYESRWRAILNYFSPAVQLGMPAPPEREQNAGTYRCVFS
jgi:type I restriction enzyme R subunit